jgi:osmotically-inducible protein OsmY
MVAFVLIVSMMGAAAEQVATDVEDSTVTARIETLYLLNQHLNPLNINTTTRNGNVVITGTVGDDVQKELAEDLALSVKGVSFVDNQLTVINTVVGVKEKRTWRQRIEDRSVSAAVKTRLLYHGQFKGLKVGMSTINNIVTLYGVVPTDAHRLKIAEIAQETKGVQNVVNDLQVRAKNSADPVQGVGRQFSDEWLESRVETAFFLNRHLSTRELDVEVDDGICILTGSVNSPEKQRVAEDIARSIQGVREVQNHITVRARNAEDMKKDVSSESRPAPSPPVTLEGSEPDEDLVESPPSEPKVTETTLAEP